MYGKLFESMYDGTLHGNWQALVTFQQMIILSNADGVVDMTPNAIAARTSIPLEIIQTGVDHLEKPDPFSRSTDLEGRRLERLDAHRPWGWRLVNHQKYKDLISLEQKRAADRERMAEKRGREKSQDVAEVAHADADADADANTRLKAAGQPPADWFVEFKSLYPKRAGDPNWRKAIQAAGTRIKEGHTIGEFIEGARRYHEFVRITDKIGTEYVMQSSRFLGPGKPFLERWDPPGVKPPAEHKTKFQKSQEALDRA